MAVNAIAASDPVVAADAAPSEAPPASGDTGAAATTEEQAAEEMYIELTSMLMMQGFMQISQEAAKIREEAEKRVSEIGSEEGL